jgi:hypothetical protein
MIVNDCICCGPCVANKRDNKNLQQDTRSEREHHPSIQAYVDLNSHAVFTACDGNQI